MDIWDVFSLGLSGKNAALNLLHLASWCTYASKRLSGVYPGVEWLGGPWAEPFKMV